jgi:dCMP deaminase
VRQDSRPSWDEWAIIVAAAVALRADCQRSRVGAVILDQDHRIIGTGYNGTVPGEPGCLAGACPRGLTSFEEVPAYSPYDSGPGACIAVHAEINAIRNTDLRRLRGSTIYVTRQPCDQCDRAISLAGLARIVYLSDHGLLEAAAHTGASR